MHLVELGFARVRIQHPDHGEVCLGRAHRKLAVCRLQVEALAHELELLSVLLVKHPDNSSPVERVVEKAQRRLLLAFAIRSDHNLAALAIPSTPVTLIFSKQVVHALWNMMLKSSMTRIFGFPPLSTCLSVPNLGAGTHMVEPYRLLSSSLAKGPSIHFRSSSEGLPSELFAVWRYTSLRTSSIGRLSS